MPNLEYYEKLNGQLRQVTLCLLIKENQVLLAMKKRGFGKGNLNGIGGKLEPGESLEEAAVRESREEVGVIPTSMHKVATLNFYFDDAGEEKGWNQECTVFIVDKWEGDPQETEEMKPEWHAIDKIPYERMWSADSYWIPVVLQGKEIKGSFLMDLSQNLKEFKIKEVRNANTKTLSKI